MCSRKISPLAREVQGGSTKVTKNVGYGYRPVEGYIETETKSCSGYPKYNYFAIEPLTSKWVIKIITTID